MNWISRFISLLLALVVQSGAYGMAAQTSADTAIVALDGLEVSARELMRLHAADGDRTTISKSLSKEMPRFLGSPDPLRLLQTMPAVATGNDLGGGISVAGCDDSHNLYSIDGMEVTNPVHMFGLFSTFNFEHFDRAEMRMACRPAGSANHLGASIEAFSPAAPDTVVHGGASAGLVLSDASIAIPVVRDVSSLALSARRSMLDIFLPDILRLDHAGIKYHFADFNATYVHMLPRNLRLRSNFFFSSDKMRMTDALYDAAGSFGWRNVDGAVAVSNGFADHLLAVSHSDNRFGLNQGTASLALPSNLTKLNYDGIFRFGKLEAGAEAVARRVKRQTSGNNYNGHGPHDSDLGIETSLSADYELNCRGTIINGGLRATVFHNNSHTKFFPQPRIKASRTFPNNLTVAVSYGLYAQFSHLVKESGSGLPTDFRINASSRFPAETSRAADFHVSGRLFGGEAAFSVDGYYKSLHNIVEFDGGVLNMINSGYDVLDDLMRGRGRAYGIAVSIIRDIGNLRGWVAYNLGKSESSFSRFGRKWFPSDHDRLHDLKATAMWRINKAWNVSASFVHATGTPYTKASFGYVVGENFICEYFPHNSSRLPSYNRLDISADFRFGSCRLPQSVNVSVFNALFNKNVLFTYVTYSPKNGLTHRNTGLKSAIPAITYSISF